jgi:hypothetical protein
LDQDDLLETQSEHRSDPGNCTKEPKALEYQVEITEKLKKCTKNFCLVEGSPHPATQTKVVKLSRENVARQEEELFTEHLIKKERFLAAMKLRVTQRATLCQ